MPNFKAAKVAIPALPFRDGEVEFLFKTKPQFNKSLIYTKIKNSSFFIELHEKTSEFVVKIDKLTKITDLALMQKALLSFERSFCSQIISSAYEYKANKELAANILSNTSELKALLAQKQKVFLEIGFGSGRHLLYQARKNPDALYIGIEIYKPSLIQVSKLARELSNVRLIDFDARIAIKELASNSLDGIYLHFPVPWDDAPSRRVISKEFKNECLRVLKKGGTFELRTDSLMYAQYAFEIFRSCDFLYLKNKSAKVISKYESRWLRLNKDIHDFIVYKNEHENSNPEIEQFSPEFVIDHSRLDFFKYIGEDYFVKISRIYEVNENTKIIQLAYGGFDTPTSSYLLSRKGEAFCFLFSEFCPNTSNKKALKRLKEYLQ